VYLLLEGNRAKQLPEFRSHGNQLFDGRMQATGDGGLFIFPYAAEVVVPEIQALAFSTSRRGYDIGTHDQQRMN
jgi:hypothetical protein